MRSFMEKIGSQISLHWRLAVQKNYCLELYIFIRSYTNINKILRAIQTYIKEKYTEYVVNISKIDSTKCYHPLDIVTLCFLCDCCFLCNSACVKCCVFVRVLIRETA